MSTDKNSADQVTQDGAVELDESDLDETAGGGEFKDGRPVLNSKVSGPAPKFDGNDWTP